MSQSTVDPSINSSTSQGGMPVDDCPPSTRHINPCDLLTSVISADISSSVNSGAYPLHAVGYTAGVCLGIVDRLDHAAHLAIYVIACTFGLNIPNFYASYVKDAYRVLQSESIPTGTWEQTDIILLDMVPLRRSLVIQYQALMKFCAIAIPIVLTTTQVPGVSDKHTVVTGLHLAILLAFFCGAATCLVFLSFKSSNEARNPAIFQAWEKWVKGSNPCDAWTLVTIPFILAFWAIIVYIAALLLHFWTGPGFWLDQGTKTGRFNNVEISFSIVGGIILLVLSLALGRLRYTAEAQQQ